MQAVSRLSLGSLLRGLLFTVLLAVLAILVVVPMLLIVYTSLLTALPFSGNKNISWTLANYGTLLTADLGQALINTAIVAFGGAALAMTFGCGMAWLAARTDIPLKPLVHLAGVMPLFVSLLVAAVTWSLLGAGRSGYLNIIFEGLGLPLRIEMQSLGGIVLLHGLYYAPYPFIFLYSALTLIHPDLEEAASVHGGDTGRNLRRVTFPLVKPALIGSFLLIVVLMAEEFPVPAILGAPVGIETLSIAIFRLMTRVPAQPNEAAAVSIMLTAIVAFLVYTQRRVLHGRDYRTVTGKGIQVRPIRLGALRWPAIVFVGIYIIIAVVLPMLALLHGSLRTSLYVPNAAAFLDVSKYSLQHLAAALANPAVQQGTVNSLTAGAITAVIGTTLFFLVAYVVNRTEIPGRQLLEYLCMMPLALPSLVMGLGILWTWINIPLPVYGTLAIIVVAFMTRFLPQGYRAVSSSISQVHHDLEHAAMVAGASRATAVRTVTLPLVRGGVIAAAFLMIVLGMRELTASLFLYTTNTRLLSIVIFEAYENGRWTAVASISLIYTMALVVLTLVARRFMRADL